MSERRARRDRALAYLSQPYIRQIEQARQAGVFRPGTVAWLDILHDDDCPKLRGGLCRCQPDLDLRYLPAGGAPWG